MFLVFMKNAQTARNGASFRRGSSSNCIFYLSLLAMRLCLHQLILKNNRPIKGYDALSRTSSLACLSFQHQADGPSARTTGGTALSPADSAPSWLRVLLSSSSQAAVTAAALVLLRARWKEAQRETSRPIDAFDRNRRRYLRDFMLDNAGPLCRAQGKAPVGSRKKSLGMPISLGASRCKSTRRRSW